jgi:glycosyltransferase involved in cell wall biosynthesis
MVRTDPLVSVIVPAYNAAAFIGAAIESARQQTYRNIEILVVDDGSTDQTLAAARALADLDHRIKVLTQTNRGVAAARNRAIAAARGEYIAPLDADDIWYPRKIEQQVQRMQNAAPNVGLVYAWSVYVDERARLTGGYYAHDLPQNVYAALIFRNLIGCGSVPLIRRGCFEHVGMYNEKFAEQQAQGCEDLDLYLRIAERYDFLAVPEFLVGYRQSGSCMSSRTGAMAKSFYLTLLDCQRRRPDIPAKVFRWSLARHCFYLHDRARSDGQRWNGLKLLATSVRLDPSLLARREFYRPLLAGPLRRMRLRRLAGSAPAASAPASVASLAAQRAKQPTPLFDVFETLYQRRLRFTESMLHRASQTPQALRPSVDALAKEPLA